MRHHDENATRCTDTSKLAPPSNDNNPNEHSLVYSLAEKYMPKRFGRGGSSDKRPMLYLAIAAGVGIWLLFAYAIGRIGDVYYDHSITNKQIIINSVTGQPVRKWSELSRAERDVIKEQARVKFPEINKIGSGVNWKPVAKWLAEEKGVTHSNPRDLFRDKSSE